MTQGFEPNGSIVLATRTRCDPGHVEGPGRFVLQLKASSTRSNVERAVTFVPLGRMEDQLISLRPIKLLGFSDCRFCSESGP